MAGETQDPTAWIGRQRQTRDHLDPTRARALEATLGRRPELHPGDPLPPCWHWLYFWETAPQDSLGPDGHEARGEFLPPIDLARRMWAGGRLQFVRDLPLGAEVVRRTTIQDVVRKEGRSGPLAFVTLRHDLAEPEARAAALTEEQTLVYRPSRAASGDSPLASGVPAWQRAIRPGPVQLFRYSALTFNGHRIHYDAPYARQVEGYPDLVVHGPLLATLMLDVLCREGRRPAPRQLDYRARAPLFAGEPAAVCGAGRRDGGVDLWVAGPEGRLCMQGAAV